MKRQISRRNFLGASAGFAGAGLTLGANPVASAAQSVGVKPGDHPDLTIKEVKVYVTDLGSYHSLNGETGELFSVVTNSGFEGKLYPRQPQPHGGLARRGKLDDAQKQVIRESLDEYLEPYLRA